MSCMKGTFRLARRIGIALLVLGIVLSAVSCGNKGNIYGDVTGSTFAAYGTVGGFPNNLVYGVDYQISEGTYTVTFYEFDGTYYWPGGYTYYTDSWLSSYTVMFSAR